MFIISFMLAKNKITANVDDKYDLKQIMGRRLSEAELQTINLVVEKSKVKRERASLLMNKGLALYFSFLFVGVIGLTYNYITKETLNILVLMGFAVLIIATIPYLQLMKKSEADIDKMLDYIFR
ncbi:MAG: hypothetical protein ACOC1K_04470 [Nanoarchaeota archaeon]